MSSISWTTRRLACYGQAMAAAPSLMQRTKAYAMSLGLVGVMLWPSTWSREAGDSFPHSTFPMFSTRRPREMTLTHALGVRPNQARVPLPPPVSSGGRDVLQSQRFVFRGIQSDPMAYCKQVASRLHERQQAGDETLRNVTAVELATSRFDVLAYFASAAGRTPLARQVYARCEVAP